MGQFQIKKIGHILAAILNAALKVLVIFLIAYPFIWMVLTSFKPYKETTVYPPMFLPHTWATEGDT